MAELGEGFELCKIAHGVELLGAEKHCDEDKVILTFKNREILVYNIADRKIVKSWSVEPKQKLSCPAVQDFSTKKYYMVRNEEQLLIWNDSVSDLRKVDFTQLFKAIKRIHICSSKAFYHEPVIVFKDNEVLPISFIGKEVAQKSQEPKQRLLWCGAHKRTDGKIWLSKILTSQSSMKVLLVMEPFEQSSVERLYCVYNINSPNAEVKLLCWSLLDDNEQTIYVSLWSDGCLYKTEVPLGDGMELDENKMTDLGCELVSRLSDASLSISKTQNVYLSHVYSSYFCVAGTTTTVAGESSKEKDIVSLWDIKFGTLSSWKHLNNLTDVSVSNPVVSGICHLQCTSSFVIVANKSSVIACSYKAERSNLGNSLGMLCITSRESKQIKPLFLGTPALIKPSESIQDWNELVSKTDETENEILRTLLDPKKTKTSKHFSSELKNYFEDKCFPKIDSKDKTSDKGKELSKRQQRRNASKPPVVSQYFVTSIFERCFKEKELWSGETGNILLKSNVLPQSCFSDFLGLVCENNQIKLLEECFQTLNGIPETSVVDCLRYILRVDDNVIGLCDNEETWTKTSPPVSLSKARFLCLLLVYPINDVFMQESLKRLHFEDMLLFVKFLLHIIISWTVPLRDFLKSGDATSKLTYVQILDWAGLVLNAHFTQLVILPEAQTLLVKLHQAVSEQINTYEHLGELEGYLSHFKDHGPLPKKDYLGAYTVESVDL